MLDPGTDGRHDLRLIPENLRRQLSRPAELEALHLALSDEPDLNAFHAGVQYNLSTILPEGEILWNEGESLADVRQGEHLAVLDPDPAHVRFRHALTALIEGQTKRQDLSTFGPWSSWMALAEYYAFARVMFLAASEQEAQVSKKNLASNVLEHVPQYDGCMLRGFYLRHVEALPPRGFESAVENLVTPFSFETSTPEHHPYWQDPVTHLILSAHSQAEGAYDGLAHIAAAALYDEERSDPVRSFQALQTGTFWAATNTGIVLRPALDAAISLAQRSGWAEVAAALQDNAARL